MCYSQGPQSSSISSEATFKYLVIFRVSISKKNRCNGIAYTSEKTSEHKLTQLMTEARFEFEMNEDDVSSLDAKANKEEEVRVVETKSEEDEIGVVEAKPGLATRIEELCQGSSSHRHPTHRLFLSCCYHIWMSVDDLNIVRPHELLNYDNQNQSNDFICPLFRSSTRRRVG